MHDPLACWSHGLRSVPVLLGLVCLAPMSFSEALLPAYQPDVGGDPSIEELMRKLREKFKRSEKDYDSFVDRVEEAVEAAIAQASWASGTGDDSDRPLHEHPFFTLVDSLSDEARKQASQEENSDETIALLNKYPWNSRLEFLLGLEFGSERPVPDHVSGFIDLGAAPVPPPGFPDLVVNQYLYGLGEIVGWQYHVKPGKRNKYGGRKTKDRPGMATAVPSWERLRIYLQGSIPDVSLFAIPQLTHQIHSRLAERRLQDAGSRPHMDEFLTLLDSKWNGFIFDVAHSKKRTAVAFPAHSLFTDDEGFAFQFIRSRALANVGDLPFIAIQTYSQFAKIYRGERLGAMDFIANTPEGSAVKLQFNKESIYLANYKKLIDLVVRAILAPDLRYPTYLAVYDYPESKIPDVRKVNYDFDMPRRHALVVWAYVDKDPEALADFLYDQILSKESNRFPDAPSLPVQLTLRVREMADEMMQTIAERIEKDRDGRSTGDFEREFSPHATYRQIKGSPTTAYLACSFHAFHRVPEQVIRDAARAVAERELAE